MQVMYQSIPKPPLSQPGNPRAFDSRQVPLSGEFDPKWGPPGGAFDFRVKTSVSGRKQKDFAILWFSRRAAFTGHCSCRFHVGFSVVVVLYSSIVEYTFVLSVERRQAEQELRSGWKFCWTCFHSLLHMPEGWGIWPSLKLWRVGHLTG